MTTLLRLCLLLASPGAAAAELPQFIVPGHGQEVAALNQLHALHHDRAFTDCTLWDAWLPHATLWTGQGPRDRYRASFLNRRIDAEGYVSMQQHRGMAHSEGWPFPAWQQSTGSGWHFSTLGEEYAVQNFGLKALTSANGWEIRGAVAEGIDPAKGLKLRATGDVVELSTPPFRCGTIVAPFLRIEWAAEGLAPDSRATVLWQLEGDRDWRPERSAAFAALRDDEGMQYANVPLYRQPGYAGIVTRYQIRIDKAAAARLTLKSVITAIDTRHPITNALYVRGCADYFCWTRDVGFLRTNIGRMRRAMRFPLEEFAVRQGKHVKVPWVGHDGRSGLAVGPDGKKEMRPGLGVGNNYWDLLPFGGQDALATLYLFDALTRFAEIERAIASHAEWAVPAADVRLAATEIQQLADEIRLDFQKRFWNAERGRFVGWIDGDRRPYDYGFTFVNLEAIAYGIATPQQARSIFDWLDGKREVAGDTSRGADIYHWRFSPRATTRRNLETYTWPWYRPEDIPWGYQVQDGGAVLGFSYHDLMARLATHGPDDAWRRLREILAWFREVQGEGGYRAYYAKPGRGTLQGGGPPGGLGMDQEFLESVLVPQVMLYGFLGLQPQADGLALNPRLPRDWPSLAITGVCLHDHVLDITARQDGSVGIQLRRRGQAPLAVRLDTQLRPFPADADRLILQRAASQTTTERPDGPK